MATMTEPVGTAADTPLTADLVALEERWGAHNYHPLDVVIDRAEGAWVYDVEGRRYLDCLAAYSAVNQGHCHPRLLATLVDQARRVTLTSRAFRNGQPYCEALRARGVLCKETHDTVIRLAPPLVVERSDLAWAVEQVRAVFAPH